MTMTTSAVDHRKLKRPNSQTGAKHDYRTKMLCMAIYAETLSLAAASKRTAVPESTIQRWLNEEGSDAVLNDLRTAIRREIAFKCAEVAVLAVDATKERLLNGDHKVLANGETVRVPVSAKDSTYIAGMMIDRHALLTGTNQGNASAALDAIATKLMQALADKPVTVGPADDKPKQINSLLASGDTG